MELMAEATDIDKASQEVGKKLREESQARERSKDGGLSNNEAMAPDGTNFAVLRTVGSGSRGRPAAWERRRREALAAVAVPNKARRELGAGGCHKLGPTERVAPARKGLENVAPLLLVRHDARERRKLEFDAL